MAPSKRKRDNTPQELTDASDAIQAQATTQETLSRDAVLHPGIPDHILHPRMRPNEVPGYLELVDGTRFYGISFGAKISGSGEVVFNTSMVGYPESLTDPSYRGQILTLTYPLIGNYGVPPRDAMDDNGLPRFFESDRIQVQGLICQDYSEEHSHWNSQQSLGDWLASQGVPALYRIDTRSLTKKLRENGCILGKIVISNTNGEALPILDPNIRNLVDEVSCKTIRTYGNGKYRVLALDCGMKYNIIRQLVSRDVTLTVVPWNYNFLNDTYDGLFISNGPGNPEMCDVAIQHISQAMTKFPKRPIFGICLGNQLLALAAGCKTYKMKYGNRGMNQPCIDMRNLRCYITPQNHGFAVDHNTMPVGWSPLFTNANDYSNEGIIHSSLPFYSAQFHPEATGGPTDTEFLFDMFVELMQGGGRHVMTVPFVPPVSASKVVLLGSGGLSIGQAGEFDYSGSQCIKAMKEEGIKVILINPNIATVQTSSGMADRVYFLPVTPDIVEEVIKKERPDGVLCAFGGQTALNCAVELEKRGVFQKYNIKILGTPISAIVKTEDRDLFAKLLESINEKIAPSKSAVNMIECVEAADMIGYPVIIRAAYALGGLGSGFANNREELVQLAEVAFSASPQVLVEKSLKGWKEIEYEVVRDCKDNCITVCNMENFDPLGIHTGDSIVVCPSQTLSNQEYFKLRKTAINVIRALGVIGECNIQYALDPDSEDYCIIEVNARLSRSSALASKATGYPLAYVAAKLSLGHDLVSLKNSVTRKTTACFEPSLDYCVVKMPRWDLRKFNRVNVSIGSAMKSVGEVMAIGRKFEEAIQKAIRMVDDNLRGFDSSLALECVDNTELDRLLREPSDQRLLALSTAFARGYTVERVWALTKIDRWFLSKLMNINILGNSMSQLSIHDLTPALLHEAKILGFADRQIANRLTGDSHGLEIRKRRLEFGIKPVVKQIDTLAAEYPARTNYLYMTYSGVENDVTAEGNVGVMVLGCGPYRIGSSVEFDWCAVSCIRTVRESGFKAIVVNCNPETVSTDYDESDKLYFEEISLERVLDIYEHCHPRGIILSVGGQIPNNISMPLYRYGVTILGTSPAMIDIAEDRYKFSQLCDSIGVDQPRWKELTNIKQAKQFCGDVGYPCLVRPSYVLSGAAMRVVNSDEQIESFLLQSALLDEKHPVVISKYIEEAKEIEMDAVGCKGQLVNYAISEHIENAGVHSGDATLVLPAQKLYLETSRRVLRATKKICHALNISGPFNIQFISKENDIKVIECNLRSSRTFPFVSKTFNCNFIEIATKVLLDIPVKPAIIKVYDLDYVCIKAPMFSFTRLLGADPVCGVEMASTGEVAGFGLDVKSAFYSAIQSAGCKIPTLKCVLLSIGPLNAKIQFISSARQLVSMGYQLYGSRGTCEFMAEHGITITRLHHPLSDSEPNIKTYLMSKQVDLVINIPDSHNNKEVTNGYIIRRTATDFGIPLFTNVKVARLFVAAMEQHQSRGPPPIKAWDEYVSQ